MNKGRLAARRSRLPKRTLRRAHRSCWADAHEVSSVFPSSSALHRRARLSLNRSTAGQPRVQARMCNRQPKIRTEIATIAITFRRGPTMGKRRRRKTNRQDAETAKSLWSINAAPKQRAVELTLPSPSPWRARRLGGSYSLSSRLQSSGAHGLPARSAGVASLGCRFAKDIGDELATLRRARRSSRPSFPLRGVDLRSLLPVPVPCFTFGARKSGQQAPQRKPR
jgi:hypothetical protein